MEPDLPVVAPEAPAQAGTGGPVNFPTPNNSAEEQSKIDLQSGELAGAVRPTSFQQFVTGLKQTSGASPVGFMPGEAGSWMRGYIEKQTEEENQRNGILKISPDEANKRYPGMPVPWNAPVDPFVAEMNYQDFKHRQELQSWKEKGGSSPYLDALAGLAGGFADPLNLALGMAAGGAASALKIPETLGSVFGQNLAVNVLTGAGSYYQEQKERQAVTLPGAAAQAVEGAVGGTLFHYVVMKPLSAVLGKAVQSIRGIPDDVQAKNLRTAVSQIEAGEKVDVSETRAETAARARGDIEGQNSTFRFQPVEHPSDTSYFLARGGKANAPIQFDRLGPGSYGVDHGAVANHMAASLTGEEQGHIGEFTPPKGAKFLDLETSANSAENKGLISAIETKLDSKLPEESIVDSGTTLKDVLHSLDDKATQGELPPNTLAQIQEAVKAEGYDGYKYVHTDENGNPSHNGVLMFDPNVQPSKVFQANPDVVPRLSEEEKQVMSDDQARAGNKREYDPDMAKEVHGDVKGKPIDVHSSAIDPILKDMHDQAMNQLQELAKTDPDVKADLDQIKKDAAQAAQEKNMAQEFKDCVAGDIS